MAHEVDGGGDHRVAVVGRREQQAGELEEDKLETGGKELFLHKK